MKKIYYSAGGTMICLILYKLSGVLLRNVIADTSKVSFIAQILFGIMSFILLVVLKRKDVIRFRITGFKEGIFTGMVYFVLYGLVILNYIFNHDPVKVSAPGIIMFVIEMMFVGISEEILFRGIIQNSIMEYFGNNKIASVRKSIIISGIIFGSVHLTNMFTPGISVKGAVVQAVCAVPVGILIGTIYFRSQNNLWVCIFFHAVNDLTSFLVSGVLSGNTMTSAIDSYSVRNIISFFVTTGIVVFVMRKRKFEETIDSSDPELFPST